MNNQCQNMPTDKKQGCIWQYVLNTSVNNNASYLNAKCTEVSGINKEDNAVFSLFSLANLLVCFCEMGGNQRR